jgi:cytoskeletal protein RodZ
MAAERPGDFGSRLREARERKGVSLRQIATRTKISVAALEALERNDISRLPGGIFSRAFVRAYANEVGLDPETAIQDFIAQFPHDSVTAGHSTSDQIEDNVALESDRQMASTVLWMLVVSVPLAGFVLYLSTMNRRVPEVPPPAAVAAPAPEPAPPPTSPAPERQTPDVAATIGSTPAPAAATTAAPQPPPAVPAAAERPVVSDRLVVGLTARRTVYVSAIADGKTVLSRLLQPGEKTSVEATRDVMLTAGDASALSLTLNGADARALGKAGELVSLRLTPANARDYLQNR